MVDMGLTRNVALRPKHPTAEIHTATAIATMSDISPLLRLPIELHMHILAYLIRQNAHIRMSPQDPAPRKRRTKWERELRDLHDWTPPMKTTGTPAVLLVCSHLASAGIMTFWSGNTFVFSTYQTFDTFAGLARPEAVANITSIELGEGYHCIESGGPLTVWDAKKGEIRPGPASGYQTYVDAEGVNTWAHKIYYGPVLRPRHLVSAHLYRDQALPSIPPKALEKLQSLTMYYWMPYPYMIPTKLSADVLSYAKNLHSGAWNDPPFTYNDELRRRQPENENEEKANRQYLHWLEARAAVYWDHSVDATIRVGETYGRLHCDRAVIRELIGMQWCSWAQEWDGWNYGKTGRGPEVLGRPRTLLEMAGEEIAVKRSAPKDPEDASWEWHRRRKQQEDEDDGEVGSKRARGL
ncbi:hypothetical protein LTR27_009660 [Elasticomyces elasticus]|nr:hypothetical protein LTR27_009660 [Elasticomyces elasticus]